MTVTNPLTIKAKGVPAFRPETFNSARVGSLPDNDLLQGEDRLRAAMHTLWNGQGMTGAVALARSSQNDKPDRETALPLTGGTINGIPSREHVEYAGRELDSRRPMPRSSSTLANIGSSSITPPPGRDRQGRYDETDNSTSTRRAIRRRRSGPPAQRGSGAAFGTTPAYLDRAMPPAPRSQALTVTKRGNINIRSIPFAYKQIVYGLTGGLSPRSQITDGSIEQENFERSNR